MWLGVEGKHADPAYILKAHRIYAWVECGIEREGKKSRITI
jgi:hypothetical protein